MKWVLWRSSHNNDGRIGKDIEFLPGWSSLGFSSSKDMCDNHFLASNAIFS
jgi:hypothetical protein